MFAQHGDGAGLWRIEIDMQVADKIVVHALKFIPTNFGGQGSGLRVIFRVRDSDHGVAALRHKVGELVEPQGPFPMLFCRRTVARAARVYHRCARVALRYSPTLPVGKGTPNVYVEQGDSHQVGNDMKEVLRNNAKQACYALCSARGTQKFLNFS